jgi:acetyl-CoA C-acetyltransferase
LAVTSDPTAAELTVREDIGNAKVAVTADGNATLH